MTTHLTHHYLTFLFFQVTKQKGGGDLTLLIPDLETEYDAESTPTKSPSSTWSPSNKSSSPTASKSSPEQSYLPCHCCRPNHQNRKTSGAEESKLGSNSSSLSWKLLLLLTIAIAALASILVISHQVIIIVNTIIIIIILIIIIFS